MKKAPEKFVVMAAILIFSLCLLLSCGGPNPFVEYQNAKNQFEAKVEMLEKISSALSRDAGYVDKLSPQDYKICYHIFWGDGNKEVENVRVLAENIGRQDEYNKWLARMLERIARCGNVRQKIEESLSRSK